MAVNKGRLGAELVGVGTGGGSLEKLTIIRSSGPVKRRKITALFNPTELTITREVRYEPEDSASAVVEGGIFAQQKLASIEPATLAVDLFFDTYEQHADPSMWKAATSLVTPLNPFQVGDATPVTDRTDEIAQLALPDRDTHKPPICTLWWGDFDIFRGVLTNLVQHYTMFLNDGTPVRATLSCTFSEHVTRAYLRETELYSADVAKTRVVRRHDTLQSIAGEQYGDPAQWRVIAKANRIVNPRDLRPGTVLMIPKLRP